MSTLAQLRAQELMLKGAIGEMSAEDRAKVDEAVRDIRKLATNYGDYGAIALVLVTMEIAKEPS